MDILDLSSLPQLETLTCNHNKLKELIMNGKRLKTLTAKHNSEYCGFPNSGMLCDYPSVSSSDLKLRIA